MRGRNAKETVASNQNLTDGADALGPLPTHSSPWEGMLPASVTDENLRTDQVGQT